MDQTRTTNTHCVRVHRFPAGTGLARHLALAAITLLAASSASGQTSLPISSTESFASPAEETVWTVALDSMPARPNFYAEVTPDANHPDLVAEIEFSNYPQPPFFCNTSIFWEPSDAFTSPAAPGPIRLDEPFLECAPDVGRFAGTTLTVTVRVLDFGAAGPPADLDVLIRGETIVPYNSEQIAFAPTFAEQTLTIPASKDTTIYQRNRLTSAGAGSYLWAGTDGFTVFPNLSSGAFWRSLFAFDVSGFVPDSAIVNEAEIELSAAGLSPAGGGVIELYEVSPAGPGLKNWTEGDADPTGLELSGVASSFDSVNWLDRILGTSPWSTPGGDVEGSALDSINVNGLGLQIFDGSALSSVVADMVATGEDEAGFQLRGPLSSGFDLGVRFNSRETNDGPLLVVRFTPTEPYQPFVDGQSLETGAFNFISEGENFRWIYDTDNDDILVTDVGGVCTVLPDLDGEQDFLPYHYQFTGTPGYTGIDCCTWQIESPQTGTLGTGQAVFYHNLNPLLPENQPPDFDGDGIIDQCDNCAFIANGPIAGTCVGGPNAGASCRADYECPTGSCSLSQEDADLDLTGDACAVPEPSLAASLGIGIAALAMRARKK